MKRVHLLLSGILSLGLVACSGGTENEKASLQQTQGASGEPVAIYKGDKDGTSSSLSPRASSDTEESSPTETPSVSDLVKEGMKNHPSKKKSAVDELMELQAAEEAAYDREAKRAERLAMIEQGKKSQEMAMLLQMLIVMSTMRQQQKMLEASGTIKAEDPNCESSAVGTSKSDLGEIMELMATYGIVTKATGN